MSVAEMQRAMRRRGIPVTDGPTTTATHLPLPSAPVRDPYEGMNKTERLRAVDLDAMRRVGIIVAWWYERWTFKLANDCRFTPDFVIQKPDGALEVEEVKGFWRDDARAKVRMFVEQYPFPVRAYSRTRDGWDVETFR
ncbi:MAG TPA: hypothetical protein VN085_07220 [Vicinamibacterales bacterium]|nr:hypothetical protein [Vicinamibacterales bacterium]